MRKFFVPILIILLLSMAAVYAANSDFLAEKRQPAVIQAEYDADKEASDKGERVTVKAGDEVITTTYGIIELSTTHAERAAERTTGDTQAFEAQPNPSIAERTAETTPAIETQPHMPVTESAHEKSTGETVTLPQTATNATTEAASSQTDESAPQIADVQSYNIAESNSAGDMIGQINATKDAKNHLRHSAFSRQGLINQLEYDGYANADAAFGADHSGAAWMEQAVLCAADYLEYAAFSRKGLIDQLVFEGFSEDEAAYGADQSGADWMEQAVVCAKEYLAIQTFTRRDLIKQLQFEGFTEEQAIHGANAAGIVQYKH